MQWKASYGYPMSRRRLRFSEPGVESTSHVMWSPVIIVVSNGELCRMWSPHSLGGVGEQHLVHGLLEASEAPCRIDSMARMVTMLWHVIRMVWFTCSWVMRLRWDCHLLACLVIGEAQEENRVKFLHFPDCGVTSSCEKLVLDHFRRYGEDWLAKGHA